VRFTPHGPPDCEANVVLSRDQIAGAASDTQVRLWGHEGGSGAPIRQPFPAYYQRYVWDHDYTAAPQTSFNEPLAPADGPDRVRECYPDAILAEYHFSGFQAQRAGGDWANLRLAFEEFDGEWYLTAVLHNEWTP
jgi:hypothetical protein